MPISYLDLFALIIALIATSTIQLGITLAAMFGMFKYMGRQIRDSNYGEFDFAAFDREKFNGMVMRLAGLFFASTIIIHVVYFLTINRTRFHVTFAVLLFVLEVAA